MDPGRPLLAYAKAFSLLLRAETREAPDALFTAAFHEEDQLLNLQLTRLHPSSPALIDMEGCCSSLTAAGPDEFFTSDAFPKIRQWTISRGYWKGISACTNRGLFLTNRPSKPCRRRDNCLSVHGLLLPGRTHSSWSCIRGAVLNVLKRKSVHAVLTENRVIKINNHVVGAMMRRLVQSVKAPGWTVARSSQEAPREGRECFVQTRGQYS